MAVGGDAHLPTDFVAACRKRWPDFKVERFEANGERVLSATMTERGRPHELSVVISRRAGGERWARDFIVDGLRAAIGLS